MATPEIEIENIAKTRTTKTKVAAAVAMGLLLVLLFSPPLLTSTTEFAPLSLGKRTFHVHVPSGDGPFPVILGLHRRGGTGWGLLQTLQALQFTKGFVIVCPDGPYNSWNVVADPSTEPDADFVGRRLLAYIAKHVNVKPSFHLFGQSNGAALTNRILIENDDARILTGITDSAQLNEYQWHDGSFFTGGPSNDYTVQKVPTRRRILQITGGADLVVPSDGTTRSRIEGMQDGTKMLFLSWQQSAEAYAQAYNVPTPFPSFTSPAPASDPDPEEVVAGNDVVVALHVTNGDHILVGDPMDPVTGALDTRIRSFLQK